MQRLRQSCRFRLSDLVIVLGIPKGIYAYVVLDEEPPEVPDAAGEVAVLVALPELGELPELVEPVGTVTVPVRVTP